MRRNEDGNERLYDEPEAEGRNRPQSERIASRGQHKRIGFTRRGASPTVYNGLHRRRKKRIMW